MKDQLLDLWESVHASFWFVPTIMAVGAILLSLLTINLDRVTGNAFASSLGFVWSGGAEGARSLLSTIAGSMITVAGTVFSITIVALTLASSQFGPRLLRNFVRDTGNQITLGTFTATFLYCILVLRTIRASDEGGFLPSISITVGVALAISSLGVLIYFIHHVSTSIQAENLIAKVGRGFCSAVDAHFPPADREPQDEATADHDFEAAVSGLTCRTIRSQRSGYIQSIDREKLIAQAQKHDLRFHLHCLPGDFVLSRDALLDVYHRPGQPPAEEVCGKVDRFFKLGKQRTEEQDVRYGARQLGEIASRALSPGINDPYTAMGCIDWMANALARVVQRNRPPGILRDKQSTPRLREEPPAFKSLCAAAWEPIIAYGLDCSLVAQHAIEALDRIATSIDNPDDAHVLKALVDRFSRQTQLLLKDEGALQQVLLVAKRVDSRLSAPEDTLRSRDPSAG